jgi:hypothetical protein
LTKKALFDKKRVFLNGINKSINGVVNARRKRMVVRLVVYLVLGVCIWVPVLSLALR